MTGIPEPYAATLRQLHQPVMDDNGGYMCETCIDDDGACADWPTPTDRAIHQLPQEEP